MKFYPASLLLIAVTFRVECVGANSVKNADSGSKDEETTAPNSPSLVVLPSWTVPSGGIIGDSFQTNKRNTGNNTSGETDDLFNNEPSRQLSASSNSRHNLSRFGRQCLPGDIGCLIEERMRTYDKILLPETADGGPVEVTVDISIRSMGPVSEYDMTFVMNCYFRQTWKDMRLKFDVNVTKWITLSIKFLERVWLPDTSFINGKRSYHHDITTPNRFIRIKPADGSLYYSTRLTIKASCPMNLVRYPMDEQSCPLMIGSFAFPSHLVTYRWLRPNNAPVTYADDRNRLGLSQFWLNYADGGNYTEKLWHDSFSLLIVQFHLQRHVGYYMIQVYTPCSLCVVLSWVGFWINREATADRITLGVTTVLTLTFLNFETRQEAPRVSYATALDWFVTTCFAFVISSIVEFALVHFYTKYGTGEYPDAISEIPDSYDTEARRARFWRRVTRRRQASIGVNLRRRMSKAIGAYSSNDEDEDDEMLSAAEIAAALPHPLPSPAELPEEILSESPLDIVTSLVTMAGGRRGSVVTNTSYVGHPTSFTQRLRPALRRVSVLSEESRGHQRLDRRRSSPRRMRQYSMKQHIWDFCCGMHAWQRYRHKYKHNLQHGRINSVSRLDIVSRLAFPLVYVGFLFVYFAYFNYFHQLL